MGLYITPCNWSYEWMVFTRGQNLHPTYKGAPIFHSISRDFFFHRPERSRKTSRWATCLGWIRNFPMELSWLLRIRFFLWIKQLDAKLLGIFSRWFWSYFFFLIPICSLFCGWPISFPTSSMTKHILNNNNLEKTQKIIQIGINLGEKNPRKKTRGVHMSLP